MVTDNHYRWDFIGLSTDDKPTPDSSHKVTDGSTFYCSDTSKLYVFYQGTWYERTAPGGGGGGSFLSNKEQTFSSDDLINGYWSTSSDSPVWTSSANRLILNRVLTLNKGDKLSVYSPTLEIGLWAYKSGNDSVNILPYTVLDEEKTFTFNETVDVLVQLKKSEGTSVEPSDFDGTITVVRQAIPELEESNDKLVSDTIEIENLTKDDFVRGTITLPTNVQSNSTTRLCTPFIRTAKKGDIISYLSPQLLVGIWVVYSGETEPVNIVPYTRANEVTTFTLPKDAIEILFQVRKYSSSSAITVDEYNCVISIIRSKIIAESDKGRLPRYECIKSVNHRGYQELAPENTLPAFRLSAEHNFEWIETDVQFTSDGVPVILHDRSINRTARNSDGSTISGTVNIDSISYTQAAQYDYGIWFGPEYAGTKIPTFEEMINYCKNLGLKVRIELKTETVTTSNLPDLIDIVNKYGMADNVEWASFGLSLLQYIATNYPTFNIGYIVTTLNATVVSDAQGLKTTTNKVTVAARKDNTDANIKLLSDAMIPLDLWTITSPGEIFNANKYVSSITTNRYNAAEVLYNLVQEIPVQPNEDDDDDDDDDDEPGPEMPV